MTDAKFEAWAKINWPGDDDVPKLLSIAFLAGARSTGEEIAARLEARADYLVQADETSLANKALAAEVRFHARSIREGME